MKAFSCCCLHLQHPILQANKGQLSSGNNQHNLEYGNLIATSIQCAECCGLVRLEKAGRGLKGFGVMYYFQGFGVTEYEEI